MNFLQSILIVGTGGFIGTVFRFLTNRLCAYYGLIAFPVATLCVNLIGCFLFGLFAGFLDKQGLANTQLSTFLIVGFCGGLTTFSTFSNELFQMTSKGEIALSILYLSISIILGVVLLFAGRLLMSGMK